MSQPGATTYSDDVRAIIEISADGALADGSPPRAVAERLDDALLYFNLLQEELGLPAGAEPRYGRLLGENGIAANARGSGPPLAAEQGPPPG